MATVQLGYVRALGYGLALVGGEVMTNRDPEGIVLEDGAKLIDLPAPVKATVEIAGKPRQVVLRVGRGILLPLIGGGSAGALDVHHRTYEKR